MKRIEVNKRDAWGFGLEIMNPYDDDCGKKDYCSLHISFFKYSIWIKTPQFFKPKHKWVDLSSESWAKERSDGRKGYDDYIQRQYGFKFTNDAIFLYYGIQPGCWNSRDPENSDHSKVFWYPWHPTIVRHDLLYPNGDVYHRNVYPRDTYGEELKWYQVFSRESNENTPETQLAVYVELEHYNKTDGKLQKAKIRLTGEEREWRPKCTRWLPIFRKVSRVVDCDSDTELGTKAGSWKGGMMGWSCEWREDETMKQAFRRWYKTWDGN